MFSVLKFSFFTAVRYSVYIAKLTEIDLDLVFIKVFLRFWLKLDELLILVVNLGRLWNYVLIICLHLSHFNVLLLSFFVMEAIRA
jgi:hypothetical protein